MKPVHFIAPAAALVLAVAWNFTGHRAVSPRTTVARAAPAGEKSPPRPRTGGGSLREAADEMLDSATEARASLAFHDRLEKMSRDELLAALDEIDGADFTADQRRALESRLADALIDRDPQAALEKFAGRMGDEADGMGWRLATALQRWAKRDLAGATAWFDRQLDAGALESKTLDGRSELRVKYEAGLLESLLAADPGAAAGRLAALPDDERREVLEQVPFRELSAATRAAYTALVRQLVPADERAGSFAHIAGQLVDGSGYGKVGDFLDAVQATPGERAAAAIQTAETRLASLGLRGSVRREDVDTLREWLGRQAPGQVDRITGKALGEAAQSAGKFDFPAASGLVLDYWKASGNDDVLVAFLESYAARSNPGEARGLAASIGDEKRRAAVMDLFK